MLDVVTQWFADAQANIVWDALVVASIFTASIVYAFTLGRNSMIVSLVAVVFASLVIHLAPATDTIPYLSEYPDSYTRVGLFAVATIIFGLIFRRNRFFEPYIVPTGFERMIFACALAGLIVAMLGSFWSGDVATIYVSMVFLHPLARLAWLVAPVVLLAIFRGDNA